AGCAALPATRRARSPRPSLPAANRAHASARALPAGARRHSFLPEIPGATARARHHRTPPRPQARAVPALPALPGASPTIVRRRCEAGRAECLQDVGSLLFGIGEKRRRTSGFGCRTPSIVTDRRARPGSAPLLGGCPAGRPPSTRRTRLAAAHAAQARFLEF